MSRAGTTAVLLGLALAGLVIVSAASGPVPVSGETAARIVAAKLFGRPDWLDGVSQLSQGLIWEVRLPRIFTCLCVGGALALAGGLFQGLLRNPLADSYTLGVSAGGALGACLGILAGVSAQGVLGVPLCSLAGSGAALAVVLVLASARGRLDNLSMILAGVIVAATLQAALGFVKFLAGENVSGLIFWLMGGFAAKTWSEAGLAGLALVLGLGASWAFARDLDAMCLGDEAAASLGVPVTALRLSLLAVGAGLSAMCVAVSGIIGFVGLVVPHMVRLAYGPRHARLLPLSALGGAFLLLAADTFARTILPREVPVGVITAMLGGPYFCLLFIRGGREAWGRDA
jgi:iron complex transport system permease protein